MNTPARKLEPWMVDFARLEHHVENALQYSGGTHNVTDIFVGIGEGQFQLWAGDDSVIVTEVVTHPRKKVCNFFLAGGDLAELETMVEPIETWAREQGCTNVGLAGRKGWHRTFLRGMGYVPMWHVMGKTL